MATTNPSDVDRSIPEVWAKRVLREHLREGRWGQFVGGGGSGIVQQLELLNKPGDTIHIPVTTPLVGAGISGEVMPAAILTGNEEKLTDAELLVIPTLTRHGVRINRRANKKSIIGLREEARMRLSEWGIDKMDAVRWTNFCQSTAMNGQTYTPNVKYAGAATTTGTLAVGDVLKVTDIRKIRTLLQSQKAKPFRVDGLDWYFGMIHPHQGLDLKGDANYNAAVQYAQVRGDSNPLFTGMLCAIEGVILFEDWRAPVVTNWGAGTVPGATGLFFGQEAFVEGVDENVMWAEEEFDYGMEWGVGYSFAFQPRRGLELASLQYRSARTIPA